ncbi:MAG: aminotransferase class I/II-fold pyridoxal phosphate-dependent enzyme, partial [Gaiellaceae bacterium]
MRPRPDRIDRLPEQYFARLLARVAAAAAQDGDEVIDLGRGNPDIGPPQHVVDALSSAAGDQSAHGYPPFRGIPELKEAVAARYRDVYGVELDPEREVAVVPGTKTAIVEVAMCLAERGETILLPDPGYPDYTSGVALAGAREGRVRLDPDEGFAPDLAGAPRDGVAALYLNYPSNPCAASAPPGVFAQTVRWAEETGAGVLHDFAYADLMFDGLRPASFLAEPGAKEVGGELFSMSKSYGMAGWRLGFVVGNAELVERVNLLQDHVRAGVFRPVQVAGVAALTGPQESVEERRAIYERRRDRVVAAVPDTRSDSTFYVWWPLPERLTPGRILAEHRIAVAPGEGFGELVRGWARILLATHDDRLDAGLSRLAALLA